MRRNVLVFATYAILALSMVKFIFYFMFSHHKTIVSSNDERKQDRSQCMDVLSEMTRGQWRQRNGISASDLTKRQQLDLFIRKNRHLPQELTRKDSRCGTRFPLPDPGFGYQLPAICNASGIKPCCNDAIGRCGNTPSHCKCSKCVDYKKVLSAELCKWESFSGCKMRNFTSSEACKLMNQRVSNLVLIGDSLMRHFHNALMIVFTNNAQGGALRRDLTEKQHKACSGEMQFVDGGKTVCHGKISRQISDVKKNSFCGGKSRFQYSFNESYCIEYAKGALAAVANLLDEKDSFVFIGVGLHDMLNFKRLKTQYVEPILQLVENKSLTGWPKIVWVTTHAHGNLKPMAFRATQGNEKVLDFNRRMKAYLEPRGVDVFDFFNLTLGLHSYDGTHYGVGVNMMKAQLLLNYLLVMK